MTGPPAAGRVTEPQPAASITLPQPAASITLPEATAGIIDRAAPAAEPSGRPGIVFDFGKVLFDWEPEALLARLLPHRAADPASAAALAIDSYQRFGGDWGEFDRGLLTPEALAERIAARTGLTAAETLSVIDAVPQALQPMPGMTALLQRLRNAGHALYFLSNMPLPYAEALEARHDFIERLFDGGIFSGRVQLIKPEPAIFRHAVATFGIRPSDAVLIDDLPANVDAARAEGWQAIHFLTPAQCEAELRRMGIA